MRRKVAVFDTVNNTILLLISLLCVYPFLYILFLSISDGISVANGEVVFLPKGINIETYKYLFSSPRLPIFRGLLNSFLYCFCSTGLALLVTFMTAYVLTRRQFRGRFFIISVFIFTWVFEAGIIPNYIVNNALHLVDNPLIMILPSMIGTQFLIITKAFIESMPYELEEAARIDGASDFQIMAIIYLPLSKTILATVGLFHAVGNWNSYITPVIYLKNPRFTTIQLVLKSLVITMTDSANDAFNTHMQNGVTLLPANLQASAIFTAILPIVCVYPLVQKYFRRGILLGSVKG